MAPHTTVRYNIFWHFSSLFIFGTRVAEPELEPPRAALFEPEPGRSWSRSHPKVGRLRNPVWHLLRLLVTIFLATSIYYSYLAPTTTVITVYYFLALLLIIHIWYHLQYFLAFLSVNHIWHHIQLLFIISLGTSLYHWYLAHLTSVSYNISWCFSPLFIFGISNNWYL